MRTIELFRIFGSIMIDNKDAIKNLGETEKKAEGIGKKLGNGIKTAGKFAGAVAGMASVAVGAGFKMVQSLGETADRLLDLSDITGMSTDEIQKWQKAADIAGTSSEAMTGASERLTRTLSTMDSEGNKARKSVEELGISYEDLIGMNADERMNAIVKALQDVEDPTERARLGTDLLGGAWKDVAPIIALGAEELANIKENSNIIDNEQLKKANDFRVTMVKLKEQLAFVFQELAISLLPAFQQFADWIASNMPKIQEVIGKVMRFIRDAIGGAIEAIGNIIKKLVEWKNNNEENIEKIKKAFSEAWEVIKRTASAFIDWFRDAWDKYGEGIEKSISAIWKTIKGVFETAFGLIRAAFDIFKALFTGDWEGLWNGIKDFVSTAWKGIGTFVSNGLDAVLSILKAILPMLLDAGKALMQSVWDGIKSVFEAIKNWFTNTFKDGLLSGIAGIVGSLFTAGKTLITGVWDGMKSVGSSVKSWVSGFFNEINEEATTKSGHFDSVLNRMRSKVTEMRGLDANNFYRDDDIPTQGRGGSTQGGGESNKPVYKFDDGSSFQSFAKGSKYIPFDMMAKVHKGEKIIPASEVRQQNQEMGINIETMIVREESDIKKIAREIFLMQKMEGRGMGYA